MTAADRRCRLCPRECGADRRSERGFCGEGERVRIARAELHMWEEPCISGENGSGTVFFSGCNLKCVFCQNHEISHGGKGFELSERELADTFLRLKSMGAHNINLVNPTHFLPQIIRAIDMAELDLPYVYNCGGYEKADSLQLLQGKVKIFLPDLKYFDSKLSRRYSAAEDYFECAIKAIEKMVEIAGKPNIQNGIMKSGVIVRHLVLPNARHDSIRLIAELRRRFAANEILVSLMRQYTPLHRACEFPEINRRTSTFEYKSVLAALEESGFDGYIQQAESASEDFVPQFYDKKYY